MLHLVYESATHNQVLKRTLMGIAPTGGILRFVIALAGAALLIFILDKFGIFRKT